MKEQHHKKRYTRPSISSGKVFEQAALACVHNTLQVPNNTSLKLYTQQNVNVGCGYTSS